MKSRPFAIAGRNIGPNDPPYCIAEVGINHNGELDRAKRMIDVAKEVLHFTSSGGKKKRKQHIVRDAFFTS